MTKEQIIQLVVNNNLVDEVYDALHFMVMTELKDIRDRSDKLNSELRLIKKFADVNKLDVIKDILSEKEENDGTEPVRHGKWGALTLTNTNNGTYTMNRCSECGLTIIDKYNYCPNCGARMDKE